jgi:tetratricopeptide (TPR) repeat protein/CHAT domain-containing protein
MVGVGVVRRLRALVAAWVVCGIAMVGAALAQGQDDLARLSAEVSRLYGQGEYAQALPIAQRYVELVRRQYGEEHPTFAAAISLLAAVYQAQLRHAEAEPLFRRSLAISEKALGPDHPNVGAALNNLARLYRAQGRLAEAEPLYRRSLPIAEKALGPNHPTFGAVLGNLADLYRDHGRLAEAESLYKRSLAIREKALGPDHPDVGTSLITLATVYVAQGRYGAAEPLYRRSLAIYEKALGTDDSAVGTPLSSLAALYVAQGRYAEAEPLLRRSLAIREKALGSDHLNVGRSLDTLAQLYRAQGRLAEAEQLYKRSLAISEKVLGPEHPDVGTSLNNLALLYSDQGRFAEAEWLYQRSLAISEKALGPEHPSVGTSLNNLAVLYRAQGRYAEAERLYKRSLPIAEKALGPEHPDVGNALNNLADLYRDQGRYAEAEPLFRRGLAIDEKVLGPEHPGVGTSLNNLAVLYRTQGRLAEAEPLYRRSLAIRERVLGPDHPNVGTSLNGLAQLYQDKGRLAEAEPLYRRSLTIYEKALGPEHPYVVASLNNLASLYREQGRLGEAEPLFRRSLGIYEKTLRAEHPDVGTLLNNLGGLYNAQGRLAEAEPLYRRSLAIREKVLGPEHPDVATALNNLAFLALKQRDWGEAAEHWRRGTGILVRRAERGLAGAAEGSWKGEAQRLGFFFAGLVKMTHRLAVEARAPGALAAEMFETAQWALASEASSSLAQMAARSAAGSPELAGLVRERQDLVGEWQAKDKLLIAAKSQEPSKRNAGAEKVLADRLGVIDARLAGIGRKLAKDFPDYAALASSAPVSVAGVQAQLGADEALVLFLDTDDRFKPLPEETFIWVVTKSEMRWVRSELGTAALAREVAALRCGLDNSLWGDKDKRARCLELLKTQRYDDRANVLSFQVARAHALYKALFGEVEDLIGSKHLLIVPSGALTQLPFQVLVTAPPKTAVPEAPAEYRDVAWLGTRQPITVLPAVSSLKALRAHAKVGRSSKAYLGIGNPLLDGDSNNANDVTRAKVARTKQACAPASIQAAMAPAAPVRSGVARVAVRGALADVAAIKSQAPLPETADELCRVAADLKAEIGEMRLGTRATEAEVKRLSTSGELARYRVLHFATHGAMAGELDKDREPGLILTPPDNATEVDDGYLSASEIASLKLDADWVILSACNTAAGGASSAEALSGIARAFIYAGARTLLVSHWAVYSDATVKLVTTAAAEIAADTKVGRAEAMRRAMRALIEKGTPIEAHPSYWAPFVVVGEGGAAAR